MFDIKAFVPFCFKCLTSTCYELFVSICLLLGRKTNCTIILLIKCVLPGLNFDLLRLSHNLNCYMTENEYCVIIKLGIKIEVNGSKLN